MSDHAGLLWAIADDPDDDVPRLVLADWYEDNGDPERAELMRSQIRRAEREAAGESRWRDFASVMARPRHDGYRGLVRECCRSDDGTPPPGGGPEEPRERQLLHANRGRWLGGLPEGVTFNRGLPERVEMPAWDYLRHADELCRRSPVLSVGLTEYAPWEEERLQALGYDDEEVARAEIVGRLASHPSLSCWVELYFVGCPGWEVYRGVLTSPHLTGLRRLVAVENAVGESVAVIVAAQHAGRFSRLRWLDLTGCASAGYGPGKEGLAAFANCPHLTNLEYFDLGGSDSSDDGLWDLAASPFMGCLRSLGLAGNRFGVFGWDALARSKTLQSLSHLDLSYATADRMPGDEGMAKLLRGRVFRQLRYLAVAHAGVTDDGVARLARAEAASGLRSLVVGGRGRSITRAGVRALARAPHLSGLRMLSLPGVPLTDAEADLLAGSRHLGGLRELSVSGGSMGKEGKAALGERFGAGLTLVE